MLANKTILFICALIVLSTSGCHKSYQEIKRERADRADKNNSKILIGISWAKQYDSFIKGVQLAVKDVNNKGGILNRPLDIIINTDEENLLDPHLSARKYQTISLDIANSFADNANVVAVIGHLSSKTALLVAPIYNNTGVLFLSPSATTIQLTNHASNYIFRTIPSDYETGTQIANYVINKGYKKIAILNDRSSYATDLTDFFSAQIAEKMSEQIENNVNPEDIIKTVFMRSFFENIVDLTPLIVNLKKTDFDIIFIATSNNELSAKIYQKSRDMGIQVPFITGKIVDSSHDRKTIVPMVFNNSLPENQKFITAYKQEYSNETNPDQLAALGYDNIMLLAHAIKQAQSSVPIKIAHSLRDMPACQALTGQYQFTESGELMSKAFYFNNQDNSGFEQLDNITSVTDIELCNNKN
jgi:branched-chain amino acid transport system substrate-binding protein